MNNYREGGPRRERARRELEGLGYLVVESRGSHGPFDLVAIPTSRCEAWRQKTVRLVQVKVGEPIRSAEQKMLAKLGSRFLRGRVMAEIWWYPSPSETPMMYEV